MKKYNIINKKNFKNISLQYGGTDSITTFITNSSFDEIKNNLLDTLFNKQFCPKILGEGYIGKVYIPNISHLEKIKLETLEIELPIVIKETKISTGTLNFDILDDKLYISGNDNLTTEVLILLYTNKLWENKKSPHLPYMIGYSSCSTTKNVDRIITERQGLNYNSDTKVDLFNSGEIFWPQKNKKDNTVFSSSLNTLQELFKYIQFNESNDFVRLPNGIECNVSTLFDYLCISFLHTHNLLVKNNITVYDMHSANIFINWLNDNSWNGDKNIKNIKNIYYKINKKIYKIETFGFVIKTGDLGMSIVKPKDDIYIIGQGSNLPTNYMSYEQLTKPNFTAFDFIGWNSQLLPEHIYRKTVSFDLINEYPYNHIMNIFKVRGTSYETKYLESLKTANELINYFSKYEVTEIEYSDDNLVLEEC